MDLTSLLDIPPWDWPRNAGKMFWKILNDPQADESDRLVAATLAGDLTVINDDLAQVLLAVVGSATESEQMRTKAAISLGPVLEQADIDEFEDPDDVPISERTFRHIQDSLRKVYLDHNTPKEVRRRILEASVRAPETWHFQDAIRDVYSSGDRDWMLTAVFAMRWVRGFDDQILVALKSADPEIQYQAVKAAGNRELDAAWPHIIKLLDEAHTPKPLLFAAISAVGSIRPGEARRTLAHLVISDDDEIAEAAQEITAIVEVGSDDEGDEEDQWIN